MTHSNDDATLEYLRPYQYSDPDAPTGGTDLRIFAVFRTSEHTLFYGQSIAADAFGELEHDKLLTKLEHRSITYGDYDILETDPFDAPVGRYTLYVVNPNYESGQVSNAITFETTDQTAVLDVLVNGESVVTDQVAYIDLTQKLDVIAEPNKLYGTDADGREVVYDREQIEGVQRIYLNDDLLVPADGSVYLRDIALASETVPSTKEKDMIYGTDSMGNQVVYPKDDLVWQDEWTQVSTNIVAIQNTLKNKQDKDLTAADGSIAVFRGSQTVGSSTNLTSLVNQVSSLVNEVQDINVTLGQITSGDMTAKDWKATSGATMIKNHPVTPSYSSIVITDLTLSQEQAFRSKNGAVVVSTDPTSAGANAVAVGTRTTTHDSAVAIGSNVEARNASVAVGASANATGTNAVAVGPNVTVSGDNGVAIGSGATATTNSVAVGQGAVASEAGVFSVGNDGSSGSIYRRIVAVQDPVNAHDAATKAYVDAHSGGGGGGEGGMSAVQHDTTLKGSGTSDSPLGVNTDVIATQEWVTSNVEEIVNNYLEQQMKPSGALHGADGVPVYVVANEKDLQSVQGQDITAPCMLVVTATEPPRFVYKPGE